MKSKANGMKWKRDAEMRVEVVKLLHHPPYTDNVVELTIPIAVPDLDRVREFAYKLHIQGQQWRGEFQGWPAYYRPEDRSRKPPNSKQAFCPAEFWIGTDHIWTFTISWEDGAEQEPLELESKYSAMYQATDDRQ
jgi:hypothetical protein